MSQNNLQSTTEACNYVEELTFKFNRSTVLQLWTTDCENSIKTARYTTAEQLKM